MPQTKRTAPAVLFYRGRNLKKYATVLSTAEISQMKMPVIPAPPDTSTAEEVISVYKNKTTAMVTLIVFLEKTNNIVLL